MASFVDSIKFFIDRILMHWPFTVSLPLKVNPIQSGDAIHIVVPHKANWPLTIAAVESYIAKTQHKCMVTVVCNFASLSGSEGLAGLNNINLIVNKHTWLGRLTRKFYRRGNGSMENALALQVGLDLYPDVNWFFMSHNDAAPLCVGWDNYFLSARENGFVVANAKDVIRIHAAHASGTLFQQREFRARKGNIWPIYKSGRMKLDVGDGVTLALCGADEPPKILPNTVDQPELIAKIEDPVLLRFAKSGSEIGFSLDRVVPVYCHVGRGTPRSEGDPSYAHKPKIEDWISYLKNH